MTGLTSVVCQSMCCIWLRTWQFLPSPVTVSGTTPLRVGVALLHGVDLSLALFIVSPHVDADFQNVVDLPLDIGLEFLHADRIVLAGIDVLPAELLRQRGAGVVGELAQVFVAEFVRKPLVVDVGFNARLVVVQIGGVGFRVGPGDGVVQRPLPVAAEPVDVVERRGAEVLILADFDRAAGRFACPSSRSGPRTARGPPNCRR